MNPQYLQAAAAILAAGAAFFGGFYAAVTVPLLGALKAEVGASEARLRLQIGELKIEMLAMEKRLSERITDKLNEHGDRITRLEERRFK